MTDDNVHPVRVFSTAFKHEVVLRLEAGAALAGLARELGITRKVLYDWRKAWRAEGLAGLNRKRGRKFGWSKPPPAVEPEGPPGPASKPDSAALALAGAEMRIAELERVIGRQQVGLDFFRAALRTQDAGETAKPTAPGSTGSSKR
jgi:transposase